MMTLFNVFLKTLISLLRIKVNIKKRERKIEQKEKKVKTNCKKIMLLEIIEFYSRSFLFPVTIHTMQLTINDFSCNPVKKNERINIIKLDFSRRNKKSYVDDETKRFLIL